jgi:hypothetical protein
MSAALCTACKSGCDVQPDDCCDHQPQEGTISTGFGTPQAQQVQPQPSSSSSTVPASARCFLLKRKPRLSAWVEGGPALGKTLLLPLISMAPCNGIMLGGE